MTQAQKPKTNGNDTKQGPKKINEPINKTVETNSQINKPINNNEVENNVENDQTLNKLINDEIYCLLNDCPNHNGNELSIKVNEKVQLNFEKNEYQQNTKANHNNDKATNVKQNHKNEKSNTNKATNVKPDHKTETDDPNQVNYYALIFLDRL